jgi:hypothetical protein
MPYFGDKSRANLVTCRSELIRIANIVIKYFDCSVVWGFRDKDAQDDAFRMGYSLVEWPNSKHNTNPSWAMDLAPYPIDWNDRDRFIYLAGHVMLIAHDLGIPLTWGGDWNRNNIIKDERFQDLGHFQLRGVIDG